jgi:hypothetical protein
VETSVTCVLSSVVLVRNPIFRQLAKALFAGEEISMPELVSSQRFGVVALLAFLAVVWRTTSEAAKIPPAVR